MNKYQLLCLLIVFINIWSSYCSTASDGKNGVCLSQGGRFPPFSLDGKPPQKSAKGPDDLTLCRIYRKKTCCTASQTYPALVSIRKLASSGEANDECLLFWEAMECAICDPEVGVRPGPPTLCKSFCESSLKACKDAFFTSDPMTQILQPCGPKDIICARASEWAVNGSHFCELAGFSVPNSKNVIDSFCFDGRPNLDTDLPYGDSPGRRGRYAKQKYNRSSTLSSFMKQLVTGNVVVWAVGGLVLTAGIMLMRRQSLSSQRKKALMARLVQEARSKQQAALVAANKKSRK